MADTRRTPDRAAEPSPDESPARPWFLDRPEALLPRLILAEVLGPPPGLRPPTLPWRRRRRG